MVARFRSISLIVHRLTVFATNLKFAGSNPMGVQVPLRAPQIPGITLIIRITLASFLAPVSKERDAGLQVQIWAQCASYLF